MSTRMKRARAGLIVLASICCVFLVVVLFRHDAAVGALTEPDPRDLAEALVRVSLDPEPLAAAGLSGAQVTTVVERAETYLVVNGDALDLADAQYAAAKADRDRLERLVRSGQGSQEDVAALAAARQACTAAASTRDGLLDALFADAISELPAASQETLSLIRANRGWTSALEFKVVNRAEPEWVALRDALANERIAAKRGEPPDESAQTFLTQLRQNAAVSAAKANLDSLLAMVTAAWEIAAGVE